MNRQMKLLFAILLFVAIFSLFANAQSLESSMPTIKVGVSEFSPCVTKPNGHFTGFEIDLWEDIADDLSLDYEYVYYDKFKDLLSAIETKQVDTAIAGITIRSNRESYADFSYPTLSSGLNILVRNDKSVSLGSLWTAIVDSGVGKTVYWFFVFMCCCAFIIWLSELGSKDVFDNRPWIGFFQSLWFTQVTVTTVGYGDKVPKTVIGKIVTALVQWIGIGLFGIAAAQMFAQFNFQKLNSNIEDVSGLYGKSVVVLEHTTSHEYLNEIGVQVSTVSNIQEAYDGIFDKTYDAFVCDTPVLLEKVKNDERFAITGEIFDKQFYGFAFPEGSDLTEKINKELLRLRENGRYFELHKKWFGG